MGGLLYKDFVAVRGKKMVTTILILTAVFIAIKFGILCYDWSDDFMMVNDAGIKVNFFDTILVSLIWFLLIMGTSMINAWLSKIIELDEKNKSMNYLFALPFGKRTYVTEKYIFIGICHYVLFSMVVFWNVVEMAFMGEGVLMNYLYINPSIALVFVCGGMFIAAIELPVYLIFEREKGQMFKTVILNLLGYVAVGYLLFGNLDVFAEWDMENLMNWAERNSFLLTLLSISAPIIVVAFYYLSYRLTVRIFARKERAYE